MKSPHWLLYRRRMIKVITALSLALCSLDTSADNFCSAIYASSGAIQGTRSCALDVAGGASGGMGSYACLADIDGIRAWCAATLTPAPSSGERDDNCPVADPVFPGSGAVTLTTVDFESGDDSPLSFERTYTSNHVAENQGGIGTGWFHSWQRWLDLTNSENGASATVVAYRDRGEPVQFHKNSGEWRTSEFSGLALKHDGSTWALTDLQSEIVESYSAQGRFQSEETRTHVRRTLTYDDVGLLTAITQHALGTTANMDVVLRLGYDSHHRLSSLSDPLGNITRYDYDARSNLTSVTWADGSVRRYAYEDARIPHALTGEIDEIGTRIATWTYDGQGRAIAVNHPDSSQDTQFVYRQGTTDIVGSQFTTTLHTQTTNGVLRPTASTSMAGDTSSTWNAAGQLIKEVDAGGRTYEYDYDAGGRPIKVVSSDPAGTSFYTTRYADASSLRPAMIASPHLIQAFAYDADGNTIGISEPPTTDPSGALGFDASKDGNSVTTAYGLTYDGLRRLLYVEQLVDGKRVESWGIIRDYGGNVYRIDANGPRSYSTNMADRDDAHRVLSGKNPTGSFEIHYDVRGRIDRFRFKEYASSENGGARRIFKVSFNYAPNGRILSRQGTVGSYDIYGREDGVDTPIGEEEINEWIDNYNYGDSPVGPLPGEQLAWGVDSGYPLHLSAICNDCHYAAGLQQDRARWIGAAARCIVMVWKLARNPAVKYGIGQGAKKAAQKIERAKAKCKPTATQVEGIPPGRIISMYDDITIGRSITNIETDVARAEFEANLLSNGWKKTLSENGRADIFRKNGSQYILRNESNAGVPTADFTPKGAPRATIKIRLPNP